MRAHCGIYLAGLLSACGAGCGGGASGAGGVGHDAAAAAAVDAAASSASISIRTLRTQAPRKGTDVSLQGVVVIGRLLRSSYAEIWIQDAGGGPFSGILVFCDAGTGCTIDHAFIRALQRGDVVNVDGLFDPFVPRHAPAEATTLRIEKPRITLTGAKQVPFASPVAASAVSKNRLDAVSLQGVYVEIADGPLTVASTAPIEFQGTCTVGSTAGPDAGVSTAPYFVGFEASSGASTLAVGLNFADSLTYCLPDPCPASIHCANPLTNQTFKKMRGIVEPRFEGGVLQTFLRLSPVLDEDLTQ